jgi:hypothetical protein
MVYPKVDGSIDIELPQQSTLHRDDEHRVKGSLGTNLLKEKKENFAAGERRNMRKHGCLDNIIR